MDQSAQVVLLLVGLIASGKSTFAQALEQHFPHFRRCNQDELGARREVENLARQSLRDGLSVCIDRTNFDATQRAHWINIAREFPGTAVWVIVFDTSYETCAIRLRERTSHPTIPNVEQGLEVLARFASLFKEPTPREGYDRLIIVKPEDHPLPSYTHADIASVLLRLKDSPCLHPSGHRPPVPLTSPRGLYSPFRSRRFSHDPHGFSNRRSTYDRDGHNESWTPRYSIGPGSTVRPSYTHPNCTAGSTDPSWRRPRQGPYRPNGGGSWHPNDEGGSNPING